MRVLIRGAGDLASGIALRLFHAKMEVVMTDLPRPTAIRRTLCFSQAILFGTITVEDVTAVFAKTPEAAVSILKEKKIPVLADPEAADIVFRSGIPVVMSGLDVTEQALIFPKDFERIRAVGNRVARIVADWLEFFYEFHRNIGYAGAPLHDPVAVVSLIRPDLLQTKPMCVEIETRGEYCRGATVGHDRKRASALVNLGIDRDGFADLLVEAVKTYGEDER